MSTPSSTSERELRPSEGLLQSLPRLALAPLPLAPLQPLLQSVVTHVAQSHPELFARLGAQANKRFLIDPENLPFVMLLQPNPDQPVLQALQRNAVPDHDACIAGTFFTLFEMVDGRLDGDALFFTRDLRISGDTEAVVTLRNALDDLDESVLDAVAASFGPLSKPFIFALLALRRLRSGV
jgi:predicted lipid carrier protein YhbT